MNNQTDLDRLARSVHSWPKNTPRVISPGDDALFEFGAVFFENHVVFNADTTLQSHIVYRQQWLARRAELQNKPSWKGAPEWAGWLCQRDDGMWFWCIEEPRVSKDGWETRHEARATYPSGDQNPENVLGDWRDTLERRPESTKQQEQDMTQQAATQQAEKQQDNSWFERGELPPVGAACLYVVSDRLSVEVEITAHAKFGICFVRVGKSGESYVSKTAELHRFRPIRTERELAIEDMMKTINVIDFVGTPHHLASEISAIMYDAGYRKDTK